ncbi:hypothetical protein R3W88_004714 [Solanum pinnatisectum]|uniref:RING-type domain-containing protein n=1 Tax=Solanum pinnatisectum TaxID=50273 RepID=A0AAV9KA45_9SOLN|nr:hypothetical protein R3W88_004714 [Solanum pinnatisectum]
MSQHDQVPWFYNVSLLNQLEHLPHVDCSFLSRLLEDSNLGDIVHEVEEEEFIIIEAGEYVDDTYSDEIEDEEGGEQDIIEIADEDMPEYFNDEEEEEVEEYDIIEIADEDMPKYFEDEEEEEVVEDQFADDEEQEACAIFLLEYKDEYTIAPLQCGHKFHAECINKWLQRKDTCPFCRASVYPTTHECLHYS